METLIGREQIYLQSECDKITKILQRLERENDAPREVKLVLRRRLHECKAGLRQANDGHYGQCQICKRQINPERLKALPGTPVCVQCSQLGDASYTLNHQPTKGGRLNATSF